MNKTIMVKGKVSNGVIEVIAMVDGKVVGYKRPLHSNTPTETMVSKQVPAHEVPRDIRKAAMQGTVTPLVKILEQLDVPDFMQERSTKLQEERNKTNKFKVIKGGK